MAGRTSGPDNRTRATGDPPGDPAWMALAAELATREPWRDTVVDEITEITVEELPELAADPELVTALRDSIDDNARLFATLAERRSAPEDLALPPRAAAFTRLLVHRGVPAQTLAQSYRIAHGAFWRTWVTELRVSITDPVRLAEALEQGASYMFLFIDTLGNAAQRLYAEERGRWVRSADAVRSQTIDDLLAGRTIDTETAARRLRYDLRREHLAFVLWAPPEAREAEWPSSADAHRFTASLDAGAPLVTTQGNGLLAGWVARRQPFAAAQVAGLSLPAGSELRAAVGGPDRGADGFRHAHDEATEARRVARLEDAESGRVTHYADVAVAALSSHDGERARRFVTAQLGALAGADVGARRLAETLEVYLQERASPRRTAARLGIHENTVAARIRAAEARLGRPIDGRVTELLVALRLSAVAGPQSRGSGIAT